ncbi:hypothetical protein LOY64_28335 [Pseudomonas corrugata]|uniref:hypothetical protein n=1 Tax=Pseudomonas corrugata TaxID=47879 RepID=UPI0022322C67|nr:hypothetical protein [Pseudomonas corrugata]UZD95129.1 hypothetical protein LOY64_28335 [Pseudomonas corrugata]
MSRLPYQRPHQLFQQIGWHARRNARRISDGICSPATTTAAKRLPMLMSFPAYQSSSSSNILDALDEFLFSGSPSTLEPFRLIVGQGQHNATPMRQTTPDY